MPASSRSSPNRRSASAAVSTSSATISFSFAETAPAVSVVIGRPPPPVSNSCGRELLGTTADGLVERAEAVPFKQRCQPLVDVSRDAHSLVDEARVELHQARPGADFLPGVFGIEDAADADDLQSAAGQEPERGDHACRACAEWSAAQAP